MPLNLWQIKAKTALINTALNEDISYGANYFAYRAGYVVAET